MCGICASVIISGDKVPDIYTDKDILPLKNRGPDNFDSKVLQYSDKIRISLSASVLHLRGESPVFQPAEDANKNVLLWNGEIFGGYLCHTHNLSDTTILLESLMCCKSVEDLLHVFRNIEGPWAFIYYQKESGLLWFGRDIFGRRSLLWNCDYSSSSSLGFNLSSISIAGLFWQEVPCDGIYCLDLNNSNEKGQYILQKYLWHKSPSGFDIRTSSNCLDSNALIQVHISEFHIKSPIKMPLNQTVPASLIDIHKCDPMSILATVLELPDFVSELHQFEVILDTAVKVRVQNHLQICQDCYRKHDSIKVDCHHSSIGLLYSGGLDSIVLAALASRHIPDGMSIDLMNVAFPSNVSKSSNNHNFENTIDAVLFDTPDRVTGKDGVAELQKLYPDRKWNFVEVNVSYAELQKERAKSIGHLILPSCTVLDDSIGCAIWFAARGQGAIKVHDNIYAEYHSPSRILLVGMGADELLAGYSKHATQFRRNSWTGLINELSTQIDRISSRNLGRDDRVIADHGREARFPFLDENVVSFLNKTPVWIKANPQYERGVGEKLLLRLLAWKIGFRNAAVLPKRAIQFGSRIARCENTKEKGSNICERLINMDK